MTEQPKWLPDDDELDRFARESSVVAGWFLYDRHGVSAMVRTAVEKALAEYDFRSSRDFFAWREREEARHKREVIEAKIGMLDQWAYCPHEPDSGDGCSSLEEANERECAGCATYYELEAELAALTTSEPQTEGEVKL